MPPPPRNRKRTGPPVVSDGQLRSRASGALWGLAVGNALGITTAGRRLPADQFPALNVGPHDELRGGGPAELRPGQVGWPVEMAFLLSTHLRQGQGYDPWECGKLYARWLEHAIHPTDPVKAALELVLDGRSGEHSGRRVWLDSSQRIHDAGALARCAPVGVYFARHRDERIRASLLDSAVTHFAPLCQLAAAATNAVVSAALTCPGAHLTAEEALAALDAELPVAAAMLGRTEPDWVLRTRDASDWLRDDIARAREDDPLLYGPDLHLFASPASVRACFRQALWELFHAPSFEAGVLDAVNRGGEADLNGAVTGALLGAVHGEGAVPRRWKDVVSEAPGPTGGPHWSTYHPRSLVTLEPR